MRFIISPLREDPTSLLRRFGYAFDHHTDKGETSFVRPLARAGYPRFHIYAVASGSSLSISIHLDQKRHTYGEETRHHGEYEDDGALAEEVRRIKELSEPPKNSSAFEP